VTVAHLLDGMAEQLRAAGIESPRREARLLLSHALGLPSDSTVLTGTPTHLERAVADKLLASLKRRLTGEPLAYILGRKEFWSLEFAVGPGVLVPRPESETLIEEAMRVFRSRSAPLRVLDLGTGSGCLLLAFLSERPKAQGTGIDISREALAYARKNAAKLGLADRATFLEHDWRDGFEGTFDAVFVNPPYLTDAEFAAAAPEVRAEPKDALAAGPDGLDAYRAVAPHLANALTGKGRAFVEIGRGQASATSAIFSSAGLETLSAVPDLSGIPRCLVLAKGPLENPRKPASLDLLGM
jgi:release factor glutamine methyltransferase